MNYFKEIKMENQHRQIKGYRELTQEEINLINEVEQKGVEFGDLFEKLEKIENIDKRWLSIGKTDLQKGLMATTRAIARPDFF